MLTAQERDNLEQAVIQEQLFKPEDGVNPHLVSDEELLTEVSAMGWKFDGKCIKFEGMPTFWNTREYIDFITNKEIPF